MVDQQSTTKNLNFHPWCIFQLPLVHLETSEKQLVVGELVFMLLENPNGPIPLRKGRKSPYLEDGIPVFM